MHDFDRTPNEFELEEWANEDDSAHEASYGESPLNEGEFEWNGSSELESTPFNEIEEMELASELLTVSTEEELDQFLGGLFKKAARAAGRFMKSGVGKSLGGALKGIAKTALPMAGSALGTIALPGLGTAAGGALGSAAANLFEVEDSESSTDEMEFETARKFVRLAGSAAKNAARETPGGRPPHRIAHAALLRAARRHAPGLLRHRARMFERQNGAAEPAGALSPDLALDDASGTAGDQPLEPAPAQANGALTPQEELEAASDLLGVANEHELERVLAQVLQKGAERVGSTLKNGVRRQLGGALKRVASQSVPGVRRALDVARGLDPLVAAARDAAQTARKAGRLFGLELEGLSPEDQEFEAARRVVRLASTAGARAGRASRSGASAPAVARAAMVDAARRHAPGLLANGQASQGSAEGTGERAQSGRWVRRGDHIVLYGAG